MSTRHSHPPLLCLIHSTTTNQSPPSVPQPGSHRLSTPHHSHDPVPFATDDPDPPQRPSTQSFPSEQQNPNSHAGPVQTPHVPRQRRRPTNALPPSPTRGAQSQSHPRFSEELASRADSARWRRPGIGIRDGRPARTRPAGRAGPQGRLNDVRGRVRGMGPTPPPYKATPRLPILPVTLASPSPFLSLYPETSSRRVGRERGGKKLSTLAHKSRARVRGRRLDPRPKP